jgi:hypothetical protein
MESTLFTTLTATEEASLSGGTKYNDYKPAKPHKPSAKPAKPAVPSALTINTLVALNLIVGNDNDGNVQAISQAINPAK